MRDNERRCLRKLTIRHNQSNVAATLNKKGLAVSKFNVHEAKSKLSQLLVQAERGEDVVISRNGVPVVRLVPCADQRTVQPVAWQSMPGWNGFQYDPAVLAPMTTEKDLAQAGWAV